MKVITEHSAYEIDVEDGTLRRYPLHTEAADLEGDGQPLRLIRTLRCEPGETAVFLVSSDDPGRTPFVRLTTPVKELIP